MSTPKFNVTSNGQTVSLLPYIAFDGVQFESFDVDGPNAGRTTSGKMIRDRVAVKEKLTITCRPLRESEVSVVLNAIAPETFSVQFISPKTGASVTRTMYCASSSAGTMFRRSGIQWWKGVTFALVQI